MPMFARRMRILRTSALLLAFLFCAAPAAAQTNIQAAGGGAVYIPLVTRAEVTTQPISQFAQSVVDLTNQERRRNGCNDLVISIKLAEAANRHSADMALNDRFSHTGSDGSTMSSRATAAGYDPTPAALAENIAVGYSTPKDVVAAWMKSDGHKKNILNCGLREIGIGFYEQPDDQANVRDDSGKLSGPYRFYWTQDFGTPQ